MKYLLIILLFMLGHSLNAQTYTDTTQMNVIEGGRFMYRTAQEFIDSSDITQMSDTADVLATKGDIDNVTVSGIVYSRADASAIQSSTNLELGDFVRNESTGATYQIQSDSVTGYETDDVAVIDLTGSYAVLQPQNGAYDVKWFGAVGDDLVPDDISIQNAIEFAEKHAGNRGGSVLIPDGDFYLDNPIILPRTGLLPDSSVWLSGINKNSSRLIGTLSFPNNRGIIEWTRETARAWNQSISNLTIVVPKVDSVKAIWYEYNVSPIDNQTKALTERLNINIQNLVVETDIQYHPAAIVFEGLCSFSSFKNIQIDPGGSGGYQFTTAFVSDTTVYGTLSNENTGINYSNFENIVVTIRKGGDGQFFRGRMLRTKWEGGFNDGNILKPDLELYNSYGNRFEGITLEGRNTTQYYLNNSVNNIFDGCSIAGPDDPPGMEGNHPGIDVVNSSSNVFRDIYVPFGVAFSPKNTHLLRIDSNSYNNIFNPLYVGADPLLEINDSSLVGSGNEIHWIEVASLDNSILKSGNHSNIDTISNTSLNNFYFLNADPRRDYNFIKNTAQTKYWEITEWDFNRGRKLTYEVLDTFTYIKFQDPRMISLNGLDAEYRLPANSIFDVYVLDSSAYINVHGVNYGGIDPIQYTLTDESIPKSQGDSLLVNSLATDDGNRIKIRGALGAGILSLEPSTVPGANVDVVGLYFRGDAAETSGRFSGILGKTFGATTQNGMVFKVGRFGTTYDAAEVNDLMEWTFNDDIIVAGESRIGNIADQGAYNLQVEGDSYYNGGLTLAGATSGTTEIVATAIAGTTTATLQAVTGTIALTADLAVTATEAVEGIVELATVAELDAGTDVSRVPNVNNLAGSDFGTKEIQIPAFGQAVAVTTGDISSFYTIPASLDGYDLVNVVASVHDKGITGTTDVQVERRRAGADVDMLSTVITLGDDFFISDEVINAANDDVLLGDVIAITIDAVHSGTAPNGLSIVLEFRKP